MTTKYYVDGVGNFLGGYDESIEPQEGWVEVTDLPESGFQIWNGTQWTWPKERLKALLAEQRYNKEIGGITVGELPIPTDDRAKTLIAGKYAKVVEENDPGATFTIKVAGSFLTITNADLITIFNTVNAHVQACFDAEAVVYAAIDADEVTTPEEIADALEAAYQAP
jgi:hypothetical protein